MSMPERLDRAVACQRSERRSKTIRQIDLLALIETRPIEIESDETAWCGLHLQKGLTDPETFDTSTSVVLTDCRAPSSGAVLCSIQTPGLGLAEIS